MELKFRYLKRDPGQLHWVFKQNNDASSASIVTTQIAQEEDEQLLLG